MQLNLTHKIVAALAELSHRHHISTLFERLPMRQLRNSLPIRFRSTAVIQAPIPVVRTMFMAMFPVTRPVSSIEQQRSAQGAQCHYQGQFTLPHIPHRRINNIQYRGLFAHRRRQECNITGPLHLDAAMEAVAIDSDWKSDDPHNWNYQKPISGFFPYLPYSQTERLHRFWLLIRVAGIWCERCYHIDDKNVDV